MIRTKIRRYDVVNFLKTDGDAAGYVEAAPDGGDPAVGAATLGISPAREACPGGS